MTRGYTSISLYKTRAVRPSTRMPAGAQDRPCTQTRTHMHTQNTLTRAQVPGHTPFTQKFKDRFTCALRYMLTCVHTNKFKDSHLYAHVHAMHTTRKPMG